MLGEAVAWIAFHRAAVRLPPRVAAFYVRAHRRARSIGDQGSLDGSASPRQTAAILDRARGHREIVEIGTGAGWTAIALALANPDARVTTFDPVPRDVIAGYLQLAPEVRDRIRFVHGPGELPGPDPRSVDMLFVDGDHERESTVAAFRAWRPRLAPGGLVVFHDFDPSWPGVQGAIDELGLSGTVVSSMFTWRAPADTG